MDDVTLYLRTALFSTGSADAHVPPGAVIADCRVLERQQGALVILVKALKSERGKVISEQASVLEIPWSKIDHIARISA